MRVNSSRGHHSCGSVRLIAAALMVGLALGCTGHAADPPEAQDRAPHRVLKCLGVIDAIEELVPGEWLVWAGGIWVNEPSCVEVLVSSEDEEIRVQLAVGVSCDGEA